MGENFFFVFRLKSTIIARVKKQTCLKKCVTFGDRISAKHAITVEMLHQVVSM